MRSQQGGVQIEAQAMLQRFGTAERFGFGEARGGARPHHHDPAPRRLRCRALHECGRHRHNLRRFFCFGGLGDRNAESEQKHR